MSGEHVVCPECEGFEARQSVVQILQLAVLTLAAVSFIVAIVKGMEEIRAVRRARELMLARVLPFPPHGGSPTVVETPAPVIGIPETSKTSTPAPEPA